MIFSFLSFKCLATTPLYNFSSKIQDGSTVNDASISTNTNYSSSYFYFVFLFIYLTKTKIVVLFIFSFHYGKDFFGVPTRQSPSNVDNSVNSKNEENGFLSQPFDITTVLTKILPFQHPTMLNTA